MTKRKIVILIYLGLAVLGLLLLAGSLADLSFQEGSPVPSGERISAPPDGNPQEIQPAGDFMLPWFLQALLALGILVVVANILWVIIRNTNLKQLGRLAAVLALLFLGGFLLSKLQLALPANQGQNAPETLPTGPAAAVETSLLAEPPETWFLVVKIILAAGVCLLCAWLIYQTVRVARREDAIVREAGAALKAIEQGADFRNVIVSAYLRMLQIVKEERGIEREESVTPREFEALLAERGIAAPPIRQITRLFEQARYSTRPPDLTDERAAVDCLSAIRAACLAVSGRGQ